MRDYIMTILEMMKKDVNSVVGLKVSYDFGGTKPIIDFITNTEIKEYQWEIDGVWTKYLRYCISFDGGTCFYGVDKFVNLCED